jgi:hypothetical protein
VFKTKVENQLNIKIKVVQSHHGGVYCGRHDPYGKIPGPFPSSYIKMELLPSILCLANLSRMAWLSDKIAHLWIWCEVFLVMQVF